MTTRSINRLDRDRHRLLEELGLFKGSRLLEELGLFKGSRSGLWDIRYSELAIYRDKNGHCRVPPGHITESGSNLGTWVKSQRASRKANKLNEERIERLDELGFFWTVYEQKR